MSDLPAGRHGRPSGGDAGIWNGRGGLIACGVALATAGGGLGAGMVWAVHSLSNPARPLIEVAIVVGYGVVLLALIAKFANAARHARPEQADNSVELMRLEGEWTARLGEALMAAAGQLEPHQAQAVQAAIFSGGITGIAAGIAELGSQSARPAVQARASMTVARRVLTMLRTVLHDLDALERETDDPRALKALFAVDEVVTRIRRAVETLAVLGGAAPRTAPRSEELHTLLRQAVAEIVDYQRVRIVRPVTGRVHGVAAVDVIHLLAELMENATKFSRPDTEVTVRVQEVASGLAVDIDDRGLGMDRAECERACALLAGLDRHQVFQRLGDGQLGFLASAAFAARHGIAVLVESNVVGGIHALVLLPHALLDASPAAPAEESLQKPASAPPSVAAHPGEAPRSGRHLTRGLEPAGPAPRPSLPRREGSYLPQPVAPELVPEPVGMSPGLMAGYQNGYRTGADEPPGDSANGYELPRREA